MKAERYYARLGSASPSYDTSDAHYSPVGVEARHDTLEAVRQDVENAVNAIRPGLTQAPRINRSEIPYWEARVGEALHRSMRISRVEASSGEVWAWMTLVLLPDLAQQRFPEKRRDRMLGYPRNVFRRCWWRFDVLGPLMEPGGLQPLGEDELVGIMERTSLAANRPLAKVLAAAILSFDESLYILPRSEFARDLVKHVRRQTGTMVLDLLGTEDLVSVVCRVGCGLGYNLTADSVNTILNASTTRT